MEIPQYTQASPTPQTVQGVVPTASTYPRDERTSSLGPGANALATGLTTLAGGLQEKQDALQRSNDQQEMTRAMLQVSAAHASLQQQLTQDATGILQGNSMGPPQDYDGLVPRYAKQATDMAQDAVQQYKSPKAQQYVLAQMAHLRDNVLLPKTMLIEAEARQQMAEYNINGTVANLQQVVGNDPSQFDMARAQAQDGIAQSGMPMAKQQIALAHANATLSMAATFSHVRDHPEVYAEQTKRRGGGALPLAAQPGLQGVVQGMGISGEGSGTQTAPYVSNELLPGIPVPPNHNSDSPEFKAWDKQYGNAFRAAARGITTTTGVVGDVAAPQAASPIAGPVPDTTVTQPSDAEIQAANSAWKYLTPQEQQSMRTRATAALNQQGAVTLTAAKQYLQDAHLAAENGRPDPNPKPPEWFAQNFGVNSREEKQYGSMQVSAHIMQQMMLHPDADNLALAESIKPVGIGQPGQIEGYNAAMRLAQSTNRGQAVLLNNEIQQQQQKALAGADPGEPLPVSRFKNVGLNEDDHTTYLQNLAVWRNRVDAPDMPNDKLQAYKESQAVTADSPDAVEQMKRYNWIADIAKTVTDARAKDSAGFVLANNTDVQALYAQAQKSGDVADYAKYADASKAEQMRLTNGTYSLTSVNERQNITALLNAPLTDNDTAASRAKRLATQYGKYWPEVAGEVQSDKKASVPDWFYGSIGTDQPYAQAKAAQLAGVDTKALQKEIDPARVTAAHAAMLREFAPMFASLGVTEGNQTPLAGLLAVAEKGMLADMRSNAGLAPEQAAKQNVAPYVGMYTYFNNRGNTAQSNTQYMVPNDQQPQKVAAGAGQVLAQIPQLNLPVPPDLTGRYKKDEAQTQWNADIINNPVWALNRGGDGLVLSVVDRYGTLRKVMTNAGTQFGYSFAALRGNIEDQPGYGNPNPNVQADLQRQQLRRSLGIR